MQKIKDTELEKMIEATIKVTKSEKEAAHEVVEVLRKVQDAGGMKVCQH